MLSHALKILHTETPSKFSTRSNELFKRVMMIISIFLAGPETVAGRVEFLGLYGCIKHHKKQHCSVYLLLNLTLRTHRNV